MSQVKTKFIEPNAVTNAKSAQMINNTIKSNVSGGTANAADNTFAALATTAVTSSANANAKGVANTFALSDHTHQLTASSGVLDSIPQYDGTSWQSILPENILAPSRVLSLVDDFMSAGDLSAGSGLMGSLNWTTSFNGAGATMATVNATSAGHPGVLRLSTGTASTAISGLFLGVSGVTSGAILLGGGTLAYEVDILFTTLGVTAQQYVATLGLADTFSAFTAIANGVYFSYSQGAGGNFWNINATAASTTTKTTTSTAVAANTWYRLTFVINAAATSVTFYVNGVSVGTITTNIPTALPCQPGMMIVKSAGTTTRTMDIDYFMLNQRFTTSR